MTSVFVTASAVALVLQAAPPPSTSGKADETANPRKRVVCVENAPIGSRIPGRRICRTVTEWEQDRIQEQEGVERAQRTNLIHGN